MHLVIRDNGVGIAPDSGRQLGERLRLDLGMRMTPRIHQLGGRIKVESRRRGTTVHDGHIAVVDLDAGLATLYRGYLNTPYFANEAGCETYFGKVSGAGIPDPGGKRHERTRDMVGAGATCASGGAMTVGSGTAGGGVCGAMITVSVGTSTA